MFYLKHFHTGLMLLAKDYRSLQDRLELCQPVLDEEVKENQKRNVCYLSQLSSSINTARAAGLHRLSESSAPDLN